MAIHIYDIFDFYGVDLLQVDRMKVMGVKIGDQKF